jgi:hypothetical protein
MEAGDLKKERINFVGESIQLEVTGSVCLTNNIKFQELNENRLHKIISSIP